MKGFVEVPPARLREALEKAGFVRATDLKYTEEVYERVHHRNPDFRVRVYTSIACGATRGCGKDAIRVVALRNPSVLEREARRTNLTCVHKATRVHRTGTVEGVLERMLGRMREAYGQLNDIVARVR